MKKNWKQIFSLLLCFCIIVHLGVVQTAPTQAAVTKYYYNQLTKSQKKIYREVKKGIQKAAEVTLSYEYQFQITKKTTAGRNEELDAASAVLKRNVLKAVEAFFYDQPIYVKENVIYHKYMRSVPTGTGEGSLYDVQVSFNRLAPAKVKKAKKLFDAIEITGTTRYEKLKSIYETVCEMGSYELGKFSYSAYGLLEKDSGITCEGYAKSIKELCDRANIPCILVSGNGEIKAVDEPQPHMWNMVQMEDGNWYAVDATWDDGRGESRGTTSYDYFLCGQNTMDLDEEVVFSESHILNEDFFENGIVFDYPELSNERYTE